MLGSHPMVKITLTCCHCGSEHLVCNGLTRNGKQRYRCHECGRSSRENPQPNGYTNEQREIILAAYGERSSLRGLTRTFGVSRNTVAGWLKKSTPRSRS
jgi:transposase-like protein